MAKLVRNNLAQATGFQREVEKEVFVVQADYFCKEYQEFSELLGNRLINKHVQELQGQHGGKKLEAEIAELREEYHKYMQKIVA